MHKIVTVELEQDILKENRRIAERNKQLLSSKGIKAFDFMGSIGSGKTLLIERIAEILKGKGVRVGVIAGDVAGDDDYKRFKAHGLEAKNLNTGKECHLDAHLVEHALSELNLESIDVLFIENVGNLVCPADFPLGTESRVIVVSITEGDDMVRKHPLIFTEGDVVIINKIDLADAMEINPEVLVNDVEEINPKAKVVLTDAKHGTGIKDLIEALELN